MSKEKTRSAPAEFGAIAKAIKAASLQAPTSKALKVRTHYLARKLATTNI
jgi:hypothetical protein